MPQSFFQRIKQELEEKIQQLKLMRLLYPKENITEVASDRPVGYMDVLREIQTISLFVIQIIDLEMYFQMRLMKLYWSILTYKLTCGLYTCQSSPPPMSVFIQQLTVLETLLIPKMEVIRKALRLCGPDSSTLLDRNIKETINILKATLMSFV